jgi:hypothetical protein
MRSSSRAARCGSAVSSSDWIIPRFPTRFPVPILHVFASHVGRLSQVPYLGLLALVSSAAISLMLGLPYDF